MHRSRQAFTLVEVLVAMALTMFIMVILSQAFVAALETFSGLKAVGDMQEDLRTAATLLRSDLSQDHFEGKRRLSDRTINFGAPDYEPIREGFMRIVQQKPSVLEGYDKYSLPSYFAGNTWNQTPPPPTSRIDGDQHYLHFAVKLRGNQREKFFSALIPGPTSPAPSQLTAKPATLLLNQAMENDAGMNVSTTVFNSPWAEVAWFLQPQGTTIEPKTASPPYLGAPLYGLYRAQFVVPADTANLPPLPSTAGYASAAAQPGIACKDDPLTSITTFFNPNDLTNPALRTFDINNPARSATLVLKNVLNFQVQILRNANDFQCSDIQPGNPGLYDSSINPYSIQALQITIRIWDPKTQMTRQITIIQDL